MQLVCSAPRARALCTVVSIVTGLIGVLGCAPFSTLGESCADAPCAPGLVCIDAICAEPPPPPPPPCESDDDCALDGDASGRVCDEGACRFADCAFDAQCGTRICVDGTCAPSQPCIGDDDCDDGDVCDDGNCRPPCGSDEDCGVFSIGGFGLQVCVDGRCLQRCLGDATCLGGGICENNICVEPQCADGANCGAEDEFCDGGRCIAFTPCAEDDDCGDVNFFCDSSVDPVRCAERPACLADNECGQGALCLDAHCRPAEGCTSDADCSDLDDECVGARCVRRPACRSDGDCPGGQSCVDLRCEDAPEPGAPTAFAAADDLGPCSAERPCTRTVFVGEQITYLVQGFDDAGVPVRGGVTAEASGGVSAAVVDDVVTVAAHTAGSGAVAIGDVEITFRVVDSAAFYAVLVTDATGAPALGASVDVGDLGVFVDQDGLAEFSQGAIDNVRSVFPDPAVVVRRGERGVILIEDFDARLAVGGRVRLSLRRDERVVDAAPLVAAVVSNGDEIGPVGLGVVLPSTEGPERADLARLFGGVSQGQVELPVLGVVPLALPAAFTLSASLPLVGDQEVRPLAEVAPAAGPAFVFALEDRREQQDLVQLALAADPTDIVLDVAEQSEGFDATIVAAGALDALPLVPDDLDRDGDGDTGELVPDFAAAAPIEVRPQLPPRERLSIKARPPNGANERALVVAGFDLPGRFVVAGTGVVRGATDVDGAPQPEPMKAVPANAAFAHARRALAVHAVFDDDELRSRAVVRGRGFSSVVDVGPLLSPPEGAFVLADVPDLGDRSIVLPAIPGATHVRVLVVADEVRYDVWSVATGALPLPPSLTDPFVGEVDAFTLASDPFGIGSGGQDVERIARKAAHAPGT